MDSSKTVALLSIVAVAVLVGLLSLTVNNNPTPSTHVPLVLFCAAGLKPPVDEVAQAYTREYGVPVQIQYGGSGTLLSNLRAAGRGDLYIAAEESYIDTARQAGLIEETFPLATMAPVLVVAKGNPKKIYAVADLYRDGIQLALANPDAAAIGRVAQLLFERSGDWEEIRKRVKVFKPTVTDLANDVKIGAVDCAVIWDAVAHQYPDLDAVVLDPFRDAKERVVLAVLKSSRNPSAALKFARYLSAVDKGQQTFSDYGYTPTEGDAWEETPEILLFSGAVNRPAVENTLDDFEIREGVRITRVYNGCGILVSQMKSGQHPDGYLACDTSFLNPVSELFESPVGISETSIVILVPQGNPKGIQNLKGLAQPGLRLGMANPGQSTLGALCVSLLESEGLLESVKPNIKTESPTGDLLVNQMRTGALDAVLVYEANAVKAAGNFEIIQVNSPGAQARQPFAVGKTTPHKQLVERLQNALRSEPSLSRYKAAGFRLQANE